MDKVLAVDLASMFVFKKNEEVARTEDGKGVGDREVGEEQIKEERGDIVK